MKAPSRNTRPVASHHRGSAAASKSAVPPVHRVAAHLARRFHQICVGVLAEVTELENLTPLQFGVLAALDDEPGIGQRRLAVRLAVDAVTAGQVVNDLERMGLVDRRVHPDDRRARVLGLTPGGLKLRRRLRPKLATAQDRILAPLSAKEQATLLALLTRVVAGNEAYAKPGNGRRRPRRKLANQETR